MDEQAPKSKNQLLDSAITAEGNVTIGDQYYNQVIEDRILDTVNFSGYAPYYKGYPFPNFIPELLSLLESERFVLIAADPMQFDLNAFLKPFAYHLLQQDNYKTCEVKQYSEMPSLHQMADEIRISDKPTIFLLPNLEPGPLQYAPQRLKALVSEHSSHCLIASTANTFEEWRLEEDIPKFCHEVKHSESAPIYTEEVLSSYLVLKLEEQGLSPDLIAEIQPEILNKLQTPSRLETFVNSLKELDAPNRPAIRKCLQKIRVSGSSLELWYRQLENHQSLIALSMCMLAGFYDDQFFTTVDRFFEKPWRYWRNRYSELEMLDYTDLSHMSGYFEYGKERIFCKHPHHRQIILAQAWRMHRRSILAVLPHLIDLVVQSVEDTSDWELFGTKGKRKALRASLALTLKEITIIDATCMKPHLLRLVAHSNREVQLVAASILANLWVKKNRLKSKTPLADLWVKWQEDEDVAATILNRAKERPGAKGEQLEANSFLSATMALTFGFIAEFIPQGELDSKFLEGLKELSKQRNKMVVDRVSYALSYMIVTHIEQLRDLIRDHFLTHPAYINPVAKILAAAYKKTNLQYPFNKTAGNSTKSILKDWTEKALEQERQPPYRKRLSHRGVLICTVARTYGLLKYDLKDHPHPIGMQYAYEILGKLRAEEVNERIRDYLLDSMLHLIKVDLKKKDFVGIDEISRISKKERLSIEDELLRLYLNERAVLKPNEETPTEQIQVELPLNLIEEPLTASIHSWYEPEARPKTKAELYLLRWLYANRIMSQIATSCLLRIAELEQTEQQKLQEMHHRLTQKEKQEKELTKTGDYAAPAFDGSIQENPETQAFLLLVAPFLSAETFEAVKKVAPVLLEGRNVKPELAQVIFDQICHSRALEKEKKALSFLYLLFDKEPLGSKDSPLPPRRSDRFFAWFTRFMVGVPTNWKYIVPILLRAPSYHQPDVELLIKEATRTWQGATNLSYLICLARPLYKRLPAKEPPSPPAISTKFKTE